MTTTFKSGDKVTYLSSIEATVRGVRCNGIIIEYWGSGWQRDQLKVERVAARYLKIDEHRQALYADCL